MRQLTWSEQEELLEDSERLWLSDLETYREEDFDGDE